VFSWTYAAENVSSTAAFWVHHTTNSRICRSYMTRFHGFLPNFVHITICWVSGITHDGQRTFADWMHFRERLLHWLCLSNTYNRIAVTICFFFGAVQLTFADLIEWNKCNHVAKQRNVLVLLRNCVAGHKGFRNGESASPHPAAANTRTTRWSESNRFL